MYKSILNFSILLIAVFFSNVAYSQIELAEDKVSWNFTIEQNGCDATIIGRIKVVEHWHINAIKLPKGSFGFPTKIEFEKSPEYQLIGGVVEPKPIIKYDEMADENLAYHEGTVIFKQKIKVLSEKDFVIEGVFNFQTCNDVKCLPDYSAPIKLKVKGCKAEEVKIDQKTLISEFTKISNDVATHKDGSTYVLVYGKWHQVPEGNSVEFYKKYILITEKDEK